MGTCTLSLLTLLSMPPQSPAPAAPTPRTAPTAVAPENWLPAECDFAVVVRAGDVARTAAPLLAGDTAAPLRKLADTFVDQVATATGLTRQDLGGALGNGFAIGLVAGGDGRVPDVVAAVDLGDAAPAVIRALGKLPPDEMGEGRNGVAAFKLPMPAGDGIVVVQSGRLVAGTQRSTVLTTLARCVGGAAAAAAAGDALADDQSFQAELRAVDAEHPPLVVAFARPAALVRRLLAVVPPAMVERVLPVVQAMQVPGFTHAFGSVAVADGALRTRLRLRTDGLSGLLQALVGRPDRLDPTAARTVPAGVPAFAIAAVDVGEVVRAALDLLGAVDPASERLRAQAFAQLQSGHGVDVTRDLLEACATPTTWVQLDAADPRQGVLRVPLREPQRFAEALGKLLGGLGAATTPRACGAFAARCLATPLPDLQPTFTIAEGALLVGTSPAALTRYAALDRRQTHPAATALLAELPPGTTWIGGATAPAANNEPTGARPALETAPRGTAVPARTLLRRDEAGLLFETQTPFAQVAAALDTTQLAALAPLPSFAARTTARPDTTTPLPQLQAIAAAEQAFVDAARSDRDRDGKPEFGTLADLVAAKALTAAQVGRAGATADVLAVGTWNVQVLLPADTDRAESAFVAVAWPANGTGSAWCLLADGRAFTNPTFSPVPPGDLATALGGDGVFAGTFGPGWHAVEAGPMPTAADEAAETAALGRAEAAGAKVDHAELARLLQSSTPAVAARAAWLLGQHHATTAVPALADAATTHHDAAVRQQAMAALLRIGDPRAQAAAMEALGDADRTVRALAAQELGRFPGPRSRDALLGLLDQQARPPAPEHPTDVVAALLALHDLDDAQVLQATATAVHAAQPESGRALAFLFQERSPQLAAKEEATLLMAVLDHPEPLLRRYAVQRLGELRDPTTARALEGRLARETAELQPLVKVSLAQVRGDAVATEEISLHQARHNAEAIVHLAHGWWRGLDTPMQAAVGGAAVLLLAGMVWLLARWWRGPALPAAYGASPPDADGN